MRLISGVWGQRSFQEHIALASPPDGVTKAAKGCFPTGHTEKKPMHIYYDVPCLKICIHFEFRLLIKITIGTKMCNRWNVLNSWFIWQPFAFTVLFIVFISKIDGSWQEVLKQLIKATDILSADWVTGIYCLHLNCFAWINHCWCQKSPLPLSNWFLKSGWERCLLKQWATCCKEQMLTFNRIFLSNTI